MTPPLAFLDTETTGVQPPSEQDRHTALGDALWAQRLYDAITGGAP